MTEIYSGKFIEILNPGFCRPSRGRDYKSRKHARVHGSIRTAEAEKHEDGGISSICSRQF